MKTLTALLLSIALSVSPSVRADGTFFYSELAAGVDVQRDKSRPEVDLQPPLGRIVLGVESRWGGYVEFEHISSIPQEEEGSGMNMLWLGQRWKF